MNEELLVELVRVIDAPARDLFEAWLDPEAMSHFLAPAPGVITQDVRVDANVGGRFSLTMKAGETSIPIAGEYRAIDRYTHLAFTWVSAATRPDSVVKLDFEELGEVQTRMTLRHVGFPSDESRRNHDGGWAHILERLQVHCT